MMAIGLSLALLLHPQDDELLRVFIQSSAWARVLTTAEGQTVRARDIRHVTCVGLDMRQMLCSWEQHSLWCGENAVTMPSLRTPAKSGSFKAQISRNTGSQTASHP